MFAVNAKKKWSEYEAGDISKENSVRDSQFTYG